MTEHDPTQHPRPSDELDRRIRDLVARAAADTPPAPRLDAGALVSLAAPTDRNRWIVGGVAGLSVAAAIVAILVVGRPAEQADPLIPATTPETPATTVDDADDTPSTSPEPATEVTVAPTTAPATVPATAPPTTAVPPTVSTTTVLAKPTTTAELVVAGPDGVRRGDTVITTEPMARALPLPNGRVLMQRQYNTSGAVAESALLVIEPGSTEPTPIDVPSEFDGAVMRLHDLATIDGEVVVVVETRPELCPNPTECIGAIWAWGPDSGRFDRLQEKVVWEGGWTRLSITEAGLVFGGETDLAAQTLRSWIVPGTEAEPIDIASLGLSGTYVECSECPTGFTIDRRGVSVAWVETDLTTFQTTLVVAPIGGEVMRLPLTDGGTVCCLDGSGPGLPIIPAVDIEVAPPGSDAADFRVVINDEGVLNGGDPRPALVVDTSTGAVTAASGFHVFG